MYICREKSWNQRPSPPIFLISLLMYFQLLFQKRSMRHGNLKLTKKKKKFLNDPIWITAMKLILEQETNECLFSVIALHLKRLLKASLLCMCIKQFFFNKNFVHKGNISNYFASEVIHKSMNSMSLPWY